MCTYNCTHKHAIKNYILPTHMNTNRTKRDRVQLVSLINPNEVGLYYQKWEEQQVLLRAWRITARTPEQKQFKTDPDSVNELTREQRVTAHTRHLIRNRPNPQERAAQMAKKRRTRSTNWIAERKEEISAPDLLIGGLPVAAALGSVCND